MCTDICTYVRMYVGTVTSRHSGTDCCVPLMPSFWSALATLHPFVSFFQVESFWRSCQCLPSEQQQWDASRKLSAEISHYQSLLPLLLRLHGPEIRNRHWLQVMTVTGCTLQLEANVFKLKHLMSASLME